MSEQRFRKMLDKSIQDDVLVVQKFLMSGDLSIPQTGMIDPLLKPPTGNSQHFEVFKVSWQSRGHFSENRPSSRGSVSSRGSARKSNFEPTTKIERLVNYVNQEAIFISSSKSQITEMLKPIRVKYGQTNPHRSLRMKYHLPIQYQF